VGVSSIVAGVQRHTAHRTTTRRQRGAAHCPQALRPRLSWEGSVQPRHAS
jgi:hypothetical protein